MRQFKTKSVAKVRIYNNLTNHVWSTKFLGSLINENLNWIDHIFTVLNKTSKNLDIIRKLSNTLPNDVLHTLYHARIASYLSCCNVAWRLMITKC